MDKKKIALLIDGGCLRAWSKETGHSYDAALIERVAHASVDPDEELFRVLYYDCEPYAGTVKLPLSGTTKKYSPSNWLHTLEGLQLFAVRKGSLHFRGWDLKDKTKPATKDDDLQARFEQKGVDMRLGLDIASYSVKRLVDRIAVITADTDMVPAFKLARQSGLQVVLVVMAAINQPPHKELYAHADLHRVVQWPGAAVTPSAAPTP